MPDRRTRRVVPSVATAAGLGVVALFSTTLVACRHVPTSIAGPASTAPTPTTTVGVDSSSQKEGQAAAKPPPELGKVPRVDGSDAAEKENDVGFRLHQKGRYAESRDAFARAVAVDPDFSTARYNLACAYARLGALGDAEQELSRVLREDLPTYRRGLERDEDLAPLRGSAEHIGRLRDLVKQIETGYRAAMARGLRVTLWGASSESRWGSNADQRSLAQPSMLRLGVYDPVSKRFLPVAPAIRRPLAALWGQQAPVGVLLTGAWNPNCGGDICQWIEAIGAEIYDDSLSGEPVAKISTTGLSIKASAAWAGDALTLEIVRTLESADKDNGTFVHTWSGAAGATVKRYGIPAPARPRRSPPRIEVDLIHPTGVTTGRESGGISWDDKRRVVTLGSGESMAVADVPTSSNAPRVVLSPTGRRALLVVDETPACNVESPRMIAREAIFMIDFDRKSATKIAEHEGRADAAFDTNGEAYAQVDDVLFQVLPSGVLEPLPKGVILSPPTLHHWSCVGFW